MINLDTLAAIADRAERLYKTLGLKDSRMTILMDLHHADHQIAIDFDRMLAADDANFGHDMLGIRQHLNRKTGEIEGCFVPRFASSTRPQP